MIDWAAISSFADEDDWSAAFGESEWTSSCTRGPFGRADVAEVIAAFAWNGNTKGWEAPHSRDNCEQGHYYGQIQMHAVFRLADGRFGYLEASADTTGWGCQDGNSFEIADSLDALIPRMSDEGRALLGFAGPTGSNVAPAIGPMHATGESRGEVVDRAVADLLPDLKKEP